MFKVIKIDAHQLAPLGENLMSIVLVRPVGWGGI